MRVLTWNLQWRERADWRSRQPAILSTLDSLRPDVAGLQEVWAGDGTTLADELAGRLGMHAAFAAPSLPPPSDPPTVPTRPASRSGSRSSAAGPSSRPAGTGSPPGTARRRSPWP